MASTEHLSSRDAWCDEGMSGMRVRLWWCKGLAEQSTWIGMAFKCLFCRQSRILLAKISCAWLGMDMAKQGTGVTPASDFRYAMALVSHVYTNLPMHSKITSTQAQEHTRDFLRCLFSRSTKDPAFQSPGFATNCSLTRRCHAFLSYVDRPDPLTEPSTFQITPNPKQRI